MHLFCTTGQKTNATGFVVEDGFTVIKDFCASDVVAPSPKAKGNHDKLRSRFEDDGVIDDQVFARDYEFSYPSATPSVVCGYPASSNVKGKTVEEVLLKGLQALDGVFMSASKPTATDISLQLASGTREVCFVIMLVSHLYLGAKTPRELNSIAVREMHRITFIDSMHPFLNDGASGASCTLGLTIKASQCREDVKDSAKISDRIKKLILSNICHRADAVAPYDEWHEDRRHQHNDSQGHGHQRRAHSRARGVFPGGDRAGDRVGSFRHQSLRERELQSFDRMACGIGERPRCANRRVLFGLGEGFAPKPDQRGIELSTFFVLSYVMTGRLAGRIHRSLINALAEGPIGFRVLGTFESSSADLHPHVKKNRLSSKTV